MRIKTILLTILSLVLVILSSVYSENLTYFLIKGGYSSWTVAKLLPGVISILIGILLAVYLIRSLSFSRFIKYSIGIIALAVCSGVYLIQNKPYIEDYSKTGYDVSELENTILNEHLSRLPSYEGLIGVVSDSCPHCMKSTEMLSTLKDRVNHREIDLYVFTTKEEVIQQFKTETHSENLSFHTIHDEDAALDLCDGRFPAFIYIKNGVPVHRWFSNDFGYPAYDWVESGLE